MLAILWVSLIHKFHTNLKLLLTIKSRRQPIQLSMLSLKVQRRQPRLLQLRVWLSIHQWDHHHKLIHLRMLRRLWQQLRREFQSWASQNQSQSQKWQKNKQLKSTMSRLMPTEMKRGWWENLNSLVATPTTQTVDLWDLKLVRLVRLPVAIPTWGMSTNQTSRSTQNCLKDSTCLWCTAWRPTNCGHIPSSLLRSQLNYQGHTLHMLQVAILSTSSTSRTPNLLSKFNSCLKKRRVLRILELWTWRGRNQSRGDQRLLLRLKQLHQVFLRVDPVEEIRRFPLKQSSLMVTQRSKKGSSVRLLVENKKLWELDLRSRKWVDQNNIKLLKEMATQKIVSL